MKKLLLCLAAALLFSGEAYSASFCADLQGNWTPPANGFPGFNVTAQDSTGAFTGTVAAGSDCNVAIQSGSGMNLSTGEFNIIWSSAPCGAGGQRHELTGGYIVNFYGGCGDASGSVDGAGSQPFYNGSSGGVPKACMLPSGNPINGQKTTSFIGFQSPGLAHFQDILNPPTGYTSYNYQGRKIAQNFTAIETLGQACNPPLITPQSVESLITLTGPATIDDFLGWASPATVDQIREGPGIAPYPCGIQYQQNIVLDCPPAYPGGPSATIEAHDNQVSVDFSYITLIRNGGGTVPSDEIFGSSWAALRAVINVINVFFRHK